MIFKLQFCKKHEQVCPGDSVPQTQKQERSEHSYNLFTQQEKQRGRNAMNTVKILRNLLKKVQR